ncbi:MAG: histidine--tRNA ligase [Candidatus Neomarinimicrobiota bacterium]
MNQLRNIKGTHDILPKESNKWQNLELIVREVCNQYGYYEIRTPIFEKTTLFSRSVGEETDIVSKEMYTWMDMDGTSLTLRPELTASVARSFIQNNLGNQSPIQRLYYMGPLFRRERPQKGRQRQFHQFGVEAFGSDNPEQDAEIIAIAWQILMRCNLADDAKLNLNSIGSKECRIAYRKALKNYILPYINDFSETSQHRFKNNPLRILDTKSEKEQNILKEAPIISDFHSIEDSKHIEALKGFLHAMNISFVINHKLVRGLDYYTKTVFEFNSITLGAQDALLGGGRYDGLVKMLGGKPTPGIGFAAGMERFLIAMNESRKELKESNPDIYLICLNEEGLSTTLKISNELRKNGFKVITDTLRRSMKSQLREANKLGSKFALILGEEEINNETLTFKDLNKSIQKTISQSKVINFFDDLTN